MNPVVVRCPLICAVDDGVREQKRSAMVVLYVDDASATLTIEHPGDPKTRQFMRSSHPEVIEWCIGFLERIEATSRAPNVN